MDKLEFSLCLRDRMDLIRDVLDQKSYEYSGDDDRLHNFKAGSKLCGLTPKVYLLGLMAKHLQCVKELCYEHLPNEEELVEEKIGDSINYLILLEALMKEERGA